MLAILQRLFARRARRGAQPRQDSEGLRSEDPAERRRVVRQLRQPDPLLYLARHDSEPVVRDAAVDRLRTLLVGGAPGLTLADREATLTICDDSTLIAHVARRGREPAIRQAAVRLVEGDRLLQEIIREDTDPDVREAARQRLSS